MLLNSIVMQMKVMLTKKNAVIMYFIMLGLVLYNYFTNILKYFGYDVLQLYHPMKIAFLGDFSAMGFYFMEYYPFLVVIPAAFSYFDDRHTKEFVYIKARTGVRNYYIGKIVATFLITFFVFTVPLLLELILNCIAYPLSAVGDPTNLSQYDSSYIFYQSLYFVPRLWIKHPYLYGVVFAFVFGVVSGVLAVFALSISMLRFVKYKITLFLPVYLLLNLIDYLGRGFNLKCCTNYFFYLRLFNPQQRSGIGYFVIVLSIFILSIAIIFYYQRKDEIN